MLLPANEAVNLSKKNIYGGYTRFQVLPKVDLELSFIWEDIAGGSFWLSIQVDCDRTKLLIIVMTAPANFKDRCFTLVVLLLIQKVLICEHWRISKLSPDSWSEWPGVQRSSWRWFKEGWSLSSEHLTMIICNRRWSQHVIFGIWEFVFSICNG